MRGFTLEEGMPTMHIPTAEEFESATGNVTLVDGPFAVVETPDEFNQGDSTLPSVVPVEEQSLALTAPVAVETPDGERTTVTYAELVEFVDERVAMAQFVEDDGTYPIDTVARKQWCLDQANMLPHCDDRFGYAKAMYAWAMSDVSDIVEYTPRKPRKTAGR